MAIPSSSGKRGKKRPLQRVPPKSLSKSPSRTSLQEAKRQVKRHLEELQKQESRLKKQQEKIERRAAALPKVIENRDRQQREMLKLRAQTIETYTDGFSKIRNKSYLPINQSHAKRSMTRQEQRRAKIQFLMLCAVLFFILILLWKSLP